MNSCHIEFLQKFTGCIRSFLSKYSGRRCFSLFCCVVLALFLFLPVPWSLSLPGEVRSEFQEKLIAQERGYIVHTPGECSRIFRKGELIFELHDPFLGFAEERLIHMLNYDKILFDQQRALRESIGDSILTGQKINSDLHAAAEIKRKIISGRKKAAGDTLFIPVIGKENQGYFVRSGSELGMLCSDKRIVRAYADDQEIKKIKNGKRVKMFVKDSLLAITGKVSHIHPIPVVLYDSPALQAFGGEIPSDFTDDGSGKIKSVHPVYCIDIYPDKIINWQNGRFVRADIDSTAVIAEKIWRLVLSAFRRDVL